MPQSCKIDEEGLKRSDSPVFGFAIAIAKCGSDPGLREDCAALSRLPIYPLLYVLNHRSEGANGALLC